MRKGQRFTPARLVRWLDTGRGTGTGADYLPWHQVTRDDPGSRGRSHLLNWRFGRLHHLLSDLELLAFAFTSMLPGIVDLREQFPLAREPHSFDVAAYCTDIERRSARGTQQIADDLGHLHPMVRQGGVEVPWVMTTDLLVTLKNSIGRPELLAISAKYDEELTDDRTLQLLRIEREYWRLQGVYWLLLTPKLYCKSVASAMRTRMLWTIGQPDVATNLIVACSSLANELQHLDQRQCLDLIARHLSLDARTAQCVLWQAVWSGHLPIDLARSLRVSEPLELLSAPAFWQQNPVASRRTTWPI